MQLLFAIAVFAIGLLGFFYVRRRRNRKQRVS
jgi:LPXTG-motif cell wall-anchored protein